MGEGNEDTYTPNEAARLLRITSHRVRQMLNAGELEGEQDEGGRWRVPQRAIHALLEERPRRERGRQGGGDRGPEEDEPATGERFWELEEELKRLHREMGRMEGRLELTQVAESTIREQLQRERERADRLEEEARGLHARLEEAARLPQAEPRPWWRRVFGGS